MRDVYANLLRDTRNLRREQARARDGWYSALPLERKEDALFELEMLLKAFGCFGNPRNHPGPPNRTPAVAHDFTEELRILRDGMNQTVAKVRELLGERDRAYVFSRYLESVLPEDALRTRLVKDQLAQDTPQESLFVLRNTFGAFVEMADGMTRLDRIPHRLYFALLGTVTREIGRNTYFDPLVTLEFRPELDRIRNHRILEVLHEAPDASHRVAALCFLSLFRALRYARLVDEFAAEPATTRRAYLILSVFRSDMRALTRYLGQQAAEHMSDAFERQLLAVPASELPLHRDALARDASELLRFRRTLESVANMLNVEIRKIFERELPALHEPIPTEALGPQLVLGTASLRATLHHAIRIIGHELVPELQDPELASPDLSRRETSLRLRRDVWMFSQVLRAFLAKAQAAPERPADAWAGATSFHFVREFLEHFRAIGYQLLRLSDYHRLEGFMDALAGLGDVDLLDPERLEIAVRECEGFYAHLDKLFHEISKRAEISDHPFDKRAAVEHLKLYLGAA
ncbi:MAG: hypothetical protein CMN30_14715 [Sandaracinus sp.]|nr:hypothetical protein [Sandaracinus sp.]